MAGPAIFASVSLIEDEHLGRDSADVGEFMLGRLREMMNRYDSSATVRARA